MEYQIEVFIASKDIHSHHRGTNGKVTKEAYQDAMRNYLWIRPSIIVHLRGGLGNQLFQYAMGRRMAYANDARLLLDTSAYAHSKTPDPILGIRQLGLSYFNIAGKFIAQRDFPNKSKINEFIDKYYNKYYGFVDANKPYYLKHYITEPEENHFTFDSHIYNRKICSTIILDGYWQTEKYFLDISDLLRRELSIKSAPDEANQLLGEAIQSTNSVCLHIRHGDNARTPTRGLGVLSLEYYWAAINLLNLDVPNPHYFIFSDDMEWTRKSLNNISPATYVTINSDRRNYEDLRLMSLCKHHITGNSTFSWWGAWLGKKQNQIVYAPKRYYQSVDRPNPDLYPDTWRTI
jgi:hypothetical protein